MPAIGEASAFGPSKGRNNKFLFIEGIFGMPRVALTWLLRGSLNMKIFASAAVIQREVSP